MENECNKFDKSACFSDGFHDNYTLFKLSVKNTFL